MSLAPEGGSQRFLNREITVDPGQKLLRIDRFLSDRLENCSRAFVQRAIEDGMIWVNGSVVRASYRVRPGDRVSIFQPYAPEEVEVLPEDIPLDVVYEDEELLVVNKPAGMVVHPGHGHFQGTLVNALLHHLRGYPLFSSGGLRPGLAHRIDRDTSGLLAVAKTEAAMRALGRQFLARTPVRIYEALVWGQFPESEGTIEGNIGRDPADRQRMRVFHDGESGKPAVTRWRVLEDFVFTTHLECRLETGRMHQIRVHMQSMRHPVFNDTRYGGDQLLRGVDSAEYRTFARRIFAQCPRQALHAGFLGLDHPCRGEHLEFRVPPPEDMLGALRLWRELAQRLGR